MTAKELSRYLKLHEITVCKYAAGKISGTRNGRVWKFDKDVIDDWIRGGESEKKSDGRPQRKYLLKRQGEKEPRR
jgi:excisionase family DNA binding protein